MKRFDHITIQQVAELINKSESTIRRLMIKDPSFPVPFKICGSVHFSESEIEEWYQCLKARRAR